MEIKEARLRLWKLEQEVVKLVTEFGVDVGVPVSDIRLTAQEVTALGDRSRRFAYEVTISAKL